MNTDNFYNQTNIIKLQLGYIQYVLSAWIAESVWYDRRIDVKSGEDVFIKRHTSELDYGEIVAGIGEERRN